MLRMTGDPCSSFSISDALLFATLALSGFAMIASCVYLPQEFKRLSTKLAGKWMFNDVHARKDGQVLNHHDYNHLKFCFLFAEVNPFAHHSRCTGFVSHKLVSAKQGSYMWTTCVV